jgi:hypothetical protein
MPEIMKKKCSKFHFQCDPYRNRCEFETLDLKTRNTENLVLSLKFFVVLSAGTEKPAF